MKTLDLKQMGVQELSTVEVHEVEGGHELPEVPWWAYLVNPVVAYIADKFVEGFNKHHK